MFLRCNARAVHTTARIDLRRSTTPPERSKGKGFANVGLLSYHIVSQRLSILLSCAKVSQHGECHSRKKLTRGKRRKNEVGSCRLRRCPFPLSHCCSCFVCGRKSEGPFPLPLRPISRHGGGLPPLSVQAREEKEKERRRTHTFLSRSLMIPPLAAVRRSNCSKRRSEDGWTFPFFQTPIMHVHFFIMTCGN